MRPRGYVAAALAVLLFVMTLGKELRAQAHGAATNGNDCSTTLGAIDVLVRSATRQTIRFNAPPTACAKPLGEVTYFAVGTSFAIPATWNARANTLTLERPLPPTTSLATTAWELRDASNTKRVAVQAVLTDFTADSQLGISYTAGTVHQSGTSAGTTDKDYGRLGVAVVGGDNIVNQVRLTIPSGLPVESTPGRQWVIRKTNTWGDPAILRFDGCGLDTTQMGECPLSSIQSIRFHVYQPQTKPLVVTLSLRDGGTSLYDIPIAIAGFARRETLPVPNFAAAFKVVCTKATTGWAGSTALFTDLDQYRPPTTCGAVGSWVPVTGTEARRAALELGARGESTVKDVNKINHDVQPQVMISGDSLPATTLAAACASDRTCKLEPAATYSINVPSTFVPDYVAAHDGDTIAITGDQIALNSCWIVFDSEDLASDVKEHIDQFGPQAFSITVHKDGSDSGKDGAALLAVEPLAACKQDNPRTRGAIHLPQPDVDSGGDAFYKVTATIKSPPPSYITMRDGTDASTAASFSARLKLQGPFSWPINERGKGIRMFITVPVNVTSLRFPASGVDLRTSSSPTAFEATTLTAGLLLAVEPWDYRVGKNPWALPLRFMGGMQLVDFTTPAFAPSFLLGLTAAFPVIESPSAIGSSIAIGAFWEVDMREPRPFDRGGHFLLTLGFNFLSLLSPSTPSTK